MLKTVEKGDIFVEEEVEDGTVGTAVVVIVEVCVSVVCALEKVGERVEGHLSCRNSSSSSSSSSKSKRRRNQICSRIHYFFRSCCCFC